ncbi:MAG: iron-sulfur cluster assembly accessory protein [Alphaproteobacteria bacterium]|nr:iron-sulfur cluster assembly accessory protein [Alphaproteobacteria bacterium]MDP6566585.1 iron-sulfur cluster assembly accessory protein [Alphaproteobacteria bacterium]
MERPPILTMTEAALTRVRELTARADGDVLGVRVSVKKGGCSGLMYEVEYAKEKKAFEEVVETQGVRVFIDPTAIMFLIGAEMDFHQDKFHAGFVFNNPNEMDRCGCGESFRVA